MADIRRTGWLDQFDRADETPLSGGGNWLYSGLGGSGNLDLVSGNATHAAGGTSGDMYWTPQSYSGELEVWGNAEGGNANGIAWGLDLYQSPGGAGVDGYRARQEVSSLAGYTRIYRIDNGTGTVIAENPADGFVQGDPGTFMLFRLLPDTDTLELWWVDTGSGGPGGTWTLSLQIVDSTYTGSFYLGCGIRDESNSQVLGWNGIGGGAIKNRTQMYRWIKN